MLIEEPPPRCVRRLTPGVGIVQRAAEDRGDVAEWLMYPPGEGGSDRQDGMHERNCLGGRRPCRATAGGGGSNAWEVSVEIDTARVPSPISRPAAGVRCGDDRERRSEGQGDLGRRVRYRWCHRFVAVYCADDEHMSRFASGRLRPHGDRSTFDRMADRRALPPVMGRCRRVETRRPHRRHPAHRTAPCERFPPCSQPPYVT